jgi:arabinose-5-phosphate isomerase
LSLKPGSLKIQEMIAAESKAKELAEKERESLNFFFDSLDCEPLEQIAKKITETRGIVVLTGVGKSGIIAEKIALTLTSSGTRALFLSPTNALHGDLGILQKDDILLLLSKSGESQELLSLVPYVRHKGTTILSIVCKPGSKLARLSDIVWELPLKQELCPFDKVPTTSTTEQTIAGDLIAVRVMEQKGFSLDDYATFHPAGSIGKQLTLRVQDLMWQGEDLPVCRSQDLLSEILVELTNKKCGCILGTGERGELIGIFTDGDLRRALQTYGNKVMDIPMEELFSKTPRTISPSLLAVDALKEMEKNPKQLITSLPVVDDQGLLLGLIRMHDILQAGI